MTAKTRWKFLPVSQRQEVCREFLSGGNRSVVLTQRSPGREAQDGPAVRQSRDRPGTGQGDRSGAPRPSQPARRFGVRAGRVPSQHPAQTLRSSTTSRSPGWSTRRKLNSLGFSPFHLRDTPCSPVYPFPQEARTLLHKTRINKAPSSILLPQLCATVLYLKTTENPVIW